MYMTDVKALVVDTLFLTTKNGITVGQLPCYFSEKTVFSAIRDGMAYSAPQHVVIWKKRARELGVYCC
jgi:hypothetical protein